MGLSRRAFLQTGGAAVGGLAAVSSGMVASPLTALAALESGDHDGPRPRNGYGPIAPTIDRTTGLALLKLPRDFSYQSFGWSGDLMSDGTPTPDRHDGMAVVDVQRRHGRSELVLIRNHERGPILAGQPLPLIGAGQAPIYDGFTVPGSLDGLGGGTTALTFSRGRFTGSRGTLAGTLTNCAGGPTPWGSWLTCEEVTLRGSLIGARDHGFVFEVPAPERGRASAVAIEDMGFMSHEAVAVHPPTGHVYLTEDNGPTSGFYRYRPHRRSRRIGDIERGGTLEMLKVVGVDNADLRQVSQGESFAVEWVEVADPTAGPERLVSPGLGFPEIQGDGRSGPFLQGEADGAAVFARGEGCWCDHDDPDIVYFVDTSGGPAGKGVVWALRVGDWRNDGHDRRDGRGRSRRPTLTAVFVSPSEEAADNPDNITVSPRRGLLVCEDGGGQVVDRTRTFGARLIGISTRGRSFVFAENNVTIDQPIPGKPAIVPADYRGFEFAGATFSPWGDVLFVNIQTPGITFAIEGPWRRGLL